MSDLKTNSQTEIDEKSLIELIDKIISPLKGLQLSYAKMVLQTAIKRIELISIIPD